MELYELNCHPQWPDVKGCWLCLYGLQISGFGKKNKTKKHSPFQWIAVKFETQVNHQQCWKFHKTLSPQQNLFVLLLFVSVYINNTCFPLLASNRTKYTFGMSSSIATTQSWRISKSSLLWPWMGWEMITACCSKTLRELQLGRSVWSETWTTWRPGLPHEPVRKKRTRCWSRAPGGWRRVEERKRRESGKSCTPKSLVSCRRKRFQPKDLCFDL